MRPHSDEHGNEFGRIFKNAARKSCFSNQFALKDFQSLIVPFSAWQALFLPLLVKTASGVTSIRPCRVTSKPAIQRTRKSCSTLVVEKPAALLPWESKNDSHFPTTSATASSYFS